MDFEEGDIEKLTQLARIDCTGEEKKNLYQNLSKILDYIEQLSELDVSDVAPCNHILPTLKNVLREDVVKEPLSREEFLKNAPASISSMVRVPPVLNKDNQWSTTRP